MKKQKMTNNAIIGPSQNILAQVNQDLLNVNSSMQTHTAIISDATKTSKQSKLSEFKDYVGYIESNLQKTKNWTNIKTSTLGAVKTINKITIDEINKTYESLRKLGKSLKGFNKK